MTSKIFPADQRAGGEPETDHAVERAVDGGEARPREAGRGATAGKTGDSTRIPEARSRTA
ncbi:MAG: hypothetical protein MZV70_63825 [Desulfobacterales bacterium]|nr:hypothetical protein [Desulfobacterales bacterium]